MNAEELRRHFHQVADAQDAISRLRRFVLDLAVRGRLVSQESDDESAPLLLRRIEQAKHQLIRSGELRQPRERDTVTELVKPFNVPSSWAWVRLDAVGAIVGGGTPPAGEARNFAEPGQGTPWLTPADLGGRKHLYVSRGARDLSEAGLRSASATVMPAGSVLFTSRAPIGNVAIASNPVATNQGFKSVVPYLMECSRYVALVLQAFAPEIDAKAPGTTFKEVSGKIVAGVPFPLPPLAEQHRIVAKVNELMALCDRLEAAQADRDVARDRLTAATLAQLNTPNAESFDDDTRFALEALQSLSEVPGQLGPLRQAIRNLGVQGKLTRQDPNDEPATQLLARIAGAEAKLTSRRGGRSSTPADGFAAAIKIDLPSGWAVARWEDIALKIGDIDHKMPDQVTEGLPYVSPRDFGPGNSINFEGAKRISRADFERLAKKIRPEVGDIIYPRYGTIGENRLVDDTREFLASYSCCVIKVLHGFVDPGYQFLYSISDVCREQARAAENRTTQANVGIQSIKNFLVPLPPLAEQRRIVLRVNQLTAVCDQLEDSLSAGATLRARLLEALLRRVIEQPDLECRPGSSEALSASISA